MLVTSIFSFSYNVFYQSQNEFQFLNYIYFVVCKCSQYGPVLKKMFGEELNCNFLTIREMTIPDHIKDNVRAVLLSKTDGSGVLVSGFLRDYKAMLHESLQFRNYGFQTIQDFIEALPDVCRWLKIITTS